MIKIIKYFNLKLNTGIFGENVFELIFYYHVAKDTKNQIFTVAMRLFCYTKFMSMDIFYLQCTETLAYFFRSLQRISLNLTFDFCVP